MNCHHKIVAALLTFLAIAAATANAQSSWTVSLTPMLNPLPVGMCGAVHLKIFDPATRDTPRNPQGYRVTLADFDMSVDGASVAGNYIDAYHYEVCGCPGGTPGGAAKVIATYPAQSLAANARIRGVNITTEAPFALAAAKGSVNPQPCTAVASSNTSNDTTRGAGRVNPAPSSNAAGSAPADPFAPAANNTATTAVPRTPVPQPTPPVPASGLASAPPVAVALPTTAPRADLAPPPAPATPPAPPATSLPAPGKTNPSSLTAVQTGRGEVQLTWPAVTGVEGYALTGPGIPISDTTGFAATGTSATTFTVPDLPVGYYQWSVGSLYKVNFGFVAPATPLADFTKATLNVTAWAVTAQNAVNPSQFYGYERTPGFVQLQWQPVSGVAYYALFGPGLPQGGVKVTGATEYLAQQVPPGNQEWAVASFYEPGPVSTAASAFSRVTVNVTAPTTAPPAASASATAPATSRYRVVATGFRVVKETVDDSLDRDGLRNEVYGAFSMFHFQGGTEYQLLDQDLRRTQVHGDTFKHAGRTRAGSASITGGLREADAFPSDPTIRVGPAGDQSFPFSVWEGSLTDDTDFEIIFPSLWEWGGGEGSYNYWFANLMSNAPAMWSAARTSVSANAITSFTTADTNAQSSSFNLVEGLRNAARGVIAVVITGGSEDRPIGLQSGGRFPSAGLLLTRRGIEGSLGAAGGTRISLTMPFVDDPGDLRLRGNYTLYLQIERVP